MSEQSKNYGMISDSQIYMQLKSQKGEYMKQKKHLKK